MKKYDERKYRHKAKQKIASGEEVIDIAPKGNYYDWTLVVTEKITRVG